MRIYIRASQVALVVKNPPANTGDIGGLGSIPGLGRSPGGGHGNPLKYSCLENPLDRGAWRAAVHGVTQSQPRPKRLSTHACDHRRWFPEWRGNHWSAMGVVGLATCPGAGEWQDDLWESASLRSIKGPWIILVFPVYSLPSFAPSSISTSPTSIPPHL